jgi:hypothetical protein
MWVLIPVVAPQDRVYRKALLSPSGEAITETNVFSQTSHPARPKRKTLPIRAGRNFPIECMRVSCNRSSLLGNRQIRLRFQPDRQGDRHRVRYRAKSPMLDLTCLLFPIAYFAGAGSP